MFGAAAGILGLTGTAAGLPLYWLWMGVGFVIGSVVGRLLLALCYYGVLTPIALVMRLRGRDALRLRRRECESYWVDLPPPPPPERYERQF
jgi:hypothetical protein